MTRSYCVELVTEMNKGNGISTIYYFKHALKAYNVFISTIVKDQSKVYMYEVIDDEEKIKSFRLLDKRESEENENNL